MKGLDFIIISIVIIFLIFIFITGPKEEILLKEDFNKYKNYIVVSKTNLIIEKYITIVNPETRETDRLKCNNLTYIIYAIGDTIK